MISRSYVDLRGHYDLLHQQALREIQVSGFAFDTAIDDPSDTRRGLTLLFRPSEEVLEKMHQFSVDVKSITANHYFYANADIHVTVMPIISCYEGFVLDKIIPEEYSNLIGSCLTGIDSFEVEFRGVFLSRSCIVVKGYPLDGTLATIRDRLRKAFSQVSLEQSLDARYVLRTAHSTLVRFKAPILAPQEVEDLVTAATDLSFGTCAVRTLSFVYNDWYQRADRVTVLREFSLS